MYRPKNIPKMENRSRAYDKYMPYISFAPFAVAFGIWAAVMIVTSSSMILRSRLISQRKNKELFIFHRKITKARNAGDYEEFFKLSFALINYLEKNSDPKDMAKNGKAYEKMRILLKKDMLESEKQKRLIRSDYKALILEEEEMEIDGLLQENRKFIIKTDGGRKDAKLIKNKYGMIDASYDCVVRSIAVGTGIKYATVYRELNRYQKVVSVFGKYDDPPLIDGWGTSFDLVKAYLQKKGYKRYDPKGRVKRFDMRTFPATGTYMLWISFPTYNHMLTIKDGKIYDNHKNYRSLVKGIISHTWATSSDMKILRKADV